MKNKPLVSIAIITYNSAKFVVETLESAKKQTYENIELVVSDDCSTDNTLQVVEQWLEGNKERFYKSRIIRVEKNTGVAGNVNRANLACTGEWVKCIAGDDILQPTCISDNLQYIAEVPDALLVLSNSVVFYNNSDREVIQKPGLLVPGFFDMSASEQYDSLVRHEVLLNANSSFVSRKIFDEITCDERMPFMDDRPFYWNFTKMGHKLYYLNKETVRYRKYEGALTGLSGKSLLSLRYLDSWTSFYYLIRKPALEERGLDTLQYEKKILWYLFVKLVLKNRGGWVNRCINYLIDKYYIKL